ncbi:CBS domain-containing protein [Gallaecimonas sp. GXIMD4217]|uniref:CBS domain-containing protein n=1 Tax=Gallaecimonas sp. GXIMD4217 TaxID=3131927 RepID=UPI00311B0A78
MKSLVVSDYMQRHPVVLMEDMSIAAAVERLLSVKQIGAPVVDGAGNLVGFASEQDFLRLLLESSYHCELVGKVSDVMRKDVLWCEPDDSVLALAERMTGQKPKIYPVLDEGKLVGVISRRDVLRAMDSQLHECYKAG